MKSFRVLRLVRFLPLLIGAARAVVAADPVDPAAPPAYIRVEKSLLADQYYLNDSLLRAGQVEGVLGGEEDCGSYLKKGRMYSDAGSLGALLSGSLFLYGAGFSVYEHRLQTVPVVTGLSAVLLDVICLGHLYRKNLRLAVDVFNRKRSVSLLPGADYHLFITRTF